MKGFSLSPTNFNFKSTLSDLINSVQSHSSKNIKVNLNYEGTEEIFADKIHLQNVLINLLDNAIKYGRSTVEVEIVCKRLVDKLIIYVADNGPGIPYEHHKEIFDQFFRVQNESNMAIKGHGIGLNYVKKIVEMHHGVVSVFKSDGTGTTMEIILPQ
ncbi:MAG: HAMP domain-containing histidine kinase [Pedobacter sp.]|nr:MAG: HAMP domain-containing histidine kinase [Pedobacter sp.]